MKWDPKDQVTMFDLLPNSVDSTTKVQPKLKFLDLFAGIGGFRLGMEQAGHECIGYVEWDKYARKSYEAIHNTEGEWTAHDITGVTDDDLRLLGGKGIDVICGGFPCQAFSVAGKRGGFDDTRGTLFFEIARIAKQIKPRILLLENVKGLLSHEQGRTFGTILNTLDELGYDCEWEVLNSKNFGVPQNRERVFIIGHLRGSGGREVFPIGEDIGEIQTFVEIAGSTKGEENTRLGQRDVVYSSKGLMGCLAATDYKQPKQILVGVGHHPTSKKQEFKGYHNNVSPCLIATDYKAPKTAMFKSGEEYRIRKLTPRECWRLQGFPDWAFDKAQEVNSDSQLYKQAGNSVTVNVIYEIAKRLN